jgi:chemotaxis protein CheZ
MCAPRHIATSCLEHVMSGILAQRPGSEADYEAIELAVMETDRGRWFLNEYAKRNRHADTDVLLTALSRIEKSVTAHREPMQIDQFRLDVLEMSKAIARTHAEIAAIKPDDATGGRFVMASGELDSIVSATESATSDILAAAERVQEAAWTLREAEADAALCDMLDERATEIYMACSFQDLTAQRIRKVIDALGFLEKRVNAMADIWQFGDETSAGDTVERANSATETSDPSLSQADVDFALVEVGINESDVSANHGELDATSAVTQPEPSDAMEIVAVQLAADVQDADDASAQTVSTSDDIDEMLFSQPDPDEDIPLQSAPGDHLQLVHSQPEVDHAIRKVKTGVELSADEAAKALDALKSMSVEERTRLFS